jgi:hypothetical protein
MSEIKISKAKLESSKDGKTLVIWSKEQTNGDTVVSPAQTHTAIIQPEIQEHFNRLAIHLAIMGGYLKAGDVDDIAMPDPKLSEGFHVHMFSIGGDETEGTDGVQLSGKKIFGGKAQNFTTAFWRFHESEASRYVFMDDVIAILTGLEAEIIAYKKGEKRGEKKQTELALDDEKGKGKVTKMQIAEPVNTDEKATAEGNLVKGKERDKYANKDAMDRVKDMPNGKGNGKKKVVQTAANPSGEAAV